MKSTFCLACNLLLVVLIALPSFTRAQSSISLEVGATVSTLYSIAPEYQPAAQDHGNFYQPAIGFRAGVALEHDFQEKFGFKTGAAFSLKGANSYEKTRWSLGYLCFPVLAVWSPISALKWGLGLEFSALLTNNRALLPDNSVALGARTELMWQLSPKFRLMVHGTLDMTNSNKITHTNENGNLLGTNIYRHFTGGLSLAYKLHTFKD